jgi:hypothetical protein
MTPTKQPDQSTKKAAAKSIQFPHTPVRREDVAPDQRLRAVADGPEAEAVHRRRELGAGEHEGPAGGRG